MQLLHGDCLELMKTLADGSVDAVITDPPYPCIKRAYGYWTEAEWFDLMRPVVRECMRLLKPTGSAVFILQPNSERVGRMRMWLWEFMLWVGKEWGIVQDAYWWNHASPPGIHSHRDIGLLRPSMATVVWGGPADCYRSQEEVLWEPSQTTKAADLEDRALRYNPSGWHGRRGRACAVSIERGGVTPFNVLPIGNTDSQSSAGALGHGAGKPLALCKWWVRYLCPPGGVVLDPFSGSGTVGLAALGQGRDAILIERDAGYVAIAEKRIAAAQGKPEEPPAEAIESVADEKPRAGWLF